MDKRASNRLRILGILVLILFFMFAIPVNEIFAVRGDAYQDALAASLAFGIALLLLAEVAPIVQSFKAGGIEITLVGNRFNEFEKRLAQLEQAAADPQRTLQDVKDTKRKPAPALKRKQYRRNDQWKGRFGGLTKSKGFELTAEFRSGGGGFVEVLLKVTAPKDATKDLDGAEFYLHQTFDPDVIPTNFFDGEAELSVISYGGYTVGAWIPSHEVELELDLSELPKAPRIIREL